MDAKGMEAIEKLKKNRDLAETLMRSGDGQQLMAMLTQGDGGAALSQATQSAALGNTQPLAEMLKALMRDKNAAAIMSRLNEQAQR